MPPQVKSHLESVRRTEVAAGVTTNQQEPVLSFDYVVFNEKVCQRDVKLLKEAFKEYEASLNEARNFSQVPHPHYHTLPHTPPLPTSNNLPAPAIPTTPLHALPIGRQRHET